MDKLTLLMMAGLPGTGKSTLAYALARELDWVVVDKDLIHSALIAQGLEKMASGAAAYEATFWLVEDFLQRQNRSVIMDTAGRHPFIMEWARKVAEKHQVRLKVLRCMAPHVVRLQRLSGRDTLASQWVTDEISDAEQELWYAHLPEETLVLDTSGPLEMVIMQAVIGLLQG